MKNRAHGLCLVAILVVPVLTAGGCTVRRHGPPAVTLTTVVKQLAGGKKGTVTIVFRPSGDWSVNGVDHPPTIKVDAPKGIALSPVYPVAGAMAGQPVPGTYKAFPDPQDVNRVQFNYEVFDKRSVPAEVKLWIRYHRYSDKYGDGFADEELKVRIPQLRASGAPVRRTAY